MKDRIEWIARQILSTGARWTRAARQWIADAPRTAPRSDDERASRKAAAAAAIAAAQSRTPAHNDESQAIRDAWVHLRDELDRHMYWHVSLPAQSAGFHLSAERETDRLLELLHRLESIDLPGVARLLKAAREAESSKGGKTRVLNRKRRGRTTQQRREKR